MSFLRSIKGLWGGRSYAGAAVALISGIMTLWIAGCGVPTENVLVDCEGNSIRITALDQIYNNEDMTDEEKRQALRDMCITDEALIDLLLQ